MEIDRLVKYRAEAVCHKACDRIIYMLGHNSNASSYYRAIIIDNSLE